MCRHAAELGETSQLGRGNHTIMRLEKIFLLIGLGLALGWGLGASKDVVKIGFVDAQQVLVTVNEGKKAQEELERKAREAQARISPMLEQLESIQKDLEAKRFAMSSDAVQAKQLDIAELRNQIESQGKEEENKLKIQQQRLIGPLQEKFLDVVRQVGRDNDFSVILTTESPGILYRRESLDLTELVIKTFNAKS